MGGAALEADSVASGEPLGLPHLPSGRMRFGGRRLRSVGAAGTSTKGRAFRTVTSPSPELIRSARNAPSDSKFDDWARGVSRKNTPAGTSKDLFEIRHTGPQNFSMRGGGKKIWADGLDGVERTALEAKFVVNPARSPFIAGSTTPSFIREKIVGDVTHEFRRYAAVVHDSSNPVRKLVVITNERAAVPFFQGLLDTFRIPGRVVVRR